MMHKVTVTAIVALYTTPGWLVVLFHTKTFFLALALLWGLLGLYLGLCYGWHALRLRHKTVVARSH